MQRVESDRGVKTQFILALPLGHRSGEDHKLVRI
jgi:hypothetical protein